MADNELKIAGISVSKGVVIAIVARAAEGVEGVVRVGGNDIASSLVRVFTRRSIAPESSVTAEVVNGELTVGVHLAVFYGYPFTKLAASVREAVAAALLSQVGVEVGSVEHPMIAEHSILWVYLQTDKGGQRKNLEVGKAPAVSFALADEKPVAVYAYCNLHGLWKADI
jgi:desulfoferrodoxin-like iron-binding protein